MIDCIVLSKDRPMQLDLLLRSISRNFIEIKNINVLYKTINDFYQKGYDKLIEKYPDIIFLKEENFKNDYLNLLDTIKTKFIINFCDDNVIIDNINIIKDLIFFENNNEICSMSLRLHEKYDYCYPAQKKMTIPILKDIKLWKWTEYDPHTCWGYPHPIDSNIYKTDYYKNLISKCKLNTPCIEGEINAMRDYTKPYMMASSKHKIITITNNRTQNWNNNICNNNQDFSLENLNKLFLENKQIDLIDIENNLKFINSGHCEYNWKYL